MSTEEKYIRGSIATGELVIHKWSGNMDYLEFASYAISDCGTYRIRYEPDKGFNRLLDEEPEEGRRCMRCFDARDYLKFGTDEMIQQVKNGDKFLTARIHMHAVPEVGQIISLQDADGNKFGEAEVTGVGEMTLEGFVQAGFDGHRKYDSLDEMKQHLRQFYDELDDTVTVIWFDYLESSHA